MPNHPPLAFNPSHVRQPSRWSLSKEELSPFKGVGAGKRKHGVFCSFKMLQGTICPFSNPLSLSPSSSTSTQAGPKTTKMASPVTPSFLAQATTTGSQIPVPSAEPLGWGAGGTQRLPSLWPSPGGRDVWGLGQSKAQVRFLSASPAFVERWACLWTQSSLRAETFSASS